MKSYKTSDAVKRVSSYFTSHRSGLSMNAEGVAFIIAEMDALAKLVLDLEVRNFNLERSGAAHSDAAFSDAVLKEILTPNSNVHLFPIIPRPVFRDNSGPKGAA
jgi:hypothetical protein